MPAALIVDGLNLAYWCGAPAALRLPLALARALLARGDRVQLYFDASAPHRLDEDDRRVYAELVREALLVVQVPSGRRADGAMLRQARATGARIVSRDRFRDYRRSYRKLIDDPARLIGGGVEQDVLKLPALGIAAPLPDSAALAWAELRAALSDPSRSRRP
jgi:hypothetical protein